MISNCERLCCSNNRIGEAEVRHLEGVGGVLGGGDGAFAGNRGQPIQCAIILQNRAASIADYGIVASQRRGYRPRPGLKTNWSLPETDTMWLTKPA